MIAAEPAKDDVLHQLLQALLGADVDDTRPDEDRLKAILATRHDVNTPAGALDRSLAATTPTGDVWR